MALVATLGILALAAALLAGAFASSTASARATRSARAALVADAEARRALALTLMRWSAVDDSLPVGGAMQRIVYDSASVPLDAADTRVVVLRVAANLHVIAADVTVPAAGVSLARRRVRMLVRRRTPIDTTIIQPPSTITRWSFGSLY